MLIPFLMMPLMTLQVLHILQELRFIFSFYFACHLAITVSFDFSFSV